MKTCVKCRHTKPPGGFYAHPGTKDKLQSWCKDCTKEGVLKRRAKALADEFKDLRPRRARTCPVTK